MPILKLISTGLKNTLTDQTTSTHIWKLKFTPKLSCFPVDLPGSGWPLGSHWVGQQHTSLPVNEEHPLQQSLPVWTEETCECSFSRETICYTQNTHGSGMHVSLLLLLRDFNARYYLVQWTLLHYHSSGKDFQISHKKIIWRNIQLFQKKKKKQTSLPPQQM